MTPEKTEEIEAKKALVAKKFEGIIAPLEARFQFYKKLFFSSSSTKWNMVVLGKFSQAGLLLEWDTLRSILIFEGLRPRSCT